MHLGKNNSYFPWFLCTRLSVYCAVRTQSSIALQVNLIVVNLNHLTVTVYCPVQNCAWFHSAIQNVRLKQSVIVIKVYNLS